MTYFNRLSHDYEVLSLSVDFITLLYMYIKCVILKRHLHSEDTLIGIL